MKYQCSLKQNMKIHSGGEWRGYGEIWVQEELPDIGYINFVILPEIESKRYLHDEMFIEKDEVKIKKKKHKMEE